MFEVKVKNTFSASHALYHYQGKQEEEHNHHFELEVKIGTSTLDVSGCAIDFHQVDKALEEIIAPYKNRSLNNFKPFDEISPSAENMAKYFYDKLLSLIENNEAHLISVTVWEDPAHAATYLAR